MISKEECKICTWYVLRSYTESVCGVCVYVCVCVCVCVCMCVCVCVCSDLVRQGSRRGSLAQLADGGPLSGAYPCAGAALQLAGLRQGLQLPQGQSYEPASQVFCLVTCQHASQAFWLMTFQRASQVFSDISTCVASVLSDVISTCVTSVLFDDISTYVTSVLFGDISTYVSSVLSWDISTCVIRTYVTSVLSATFQHTSQVFCLVIFQFA